MFSLFAFGCLTLVSAAPQSNLPQPPLRPECTARNYLEIPLAVANCTDITLQDVFLPGNISLNLALLPNSRVTFSGRTTFGFTNSSTFNPISVSGNHVIVTSSPGAIIDGNGQAYWDGIGSNGGVPKPDHFIVVNKVTNDSVIENLHIQNWPTHCFSISDATDLTIRNIFLDNRAGDAPNERSAGLKAAENTDGFDVSSCSNCLISSSTVYNQDDCVAVTSGNNITVTGMFCSGSHGLSIGSIGGKSDNNVTNVLFTDSTITSSQNGARIKTNFNTTGFVANITYSHIQLSNISIYGIDVQQDYLNGGPTGIPSNGVIIQDILFEDITGTMDREVGSSQDYFVLCGDGSCSDIKFRGVDIRAGGTPSSCNFPSEGCPGHVGVNGTLVGGNRRVV